MARLLITSRRDNGVAANTRFAKIIRQLDKHAVVYRLPFVFEGPRELAGRGVLHVESKGDQIRCRMAGEVLRPSPFEYVFHSFWLTRHGMFVLVNSILNDPGDGRQFMRAVGEVPHELKLEAAQWLRRFHRPAK
jgi:hypothetical protein